MENHLDGLPEYGVTLTGTIYEPVVENHSQKTIVGYVFRESTRDGPGYATNHLDFPALMREGAGLQPGGMERLKRGGRRPPAGLRLEAVLFDDGQLGGGDAFDYASYVTRLDALRELGNSLQRGELNWSHLETLSMRAHQVGHTDAAGKRLFKLERGEDLTALSAQVLAADVLLRIRKNEGDSAAENSVRHMANIPQVWR